MIEPPIRPRRTAMRRSAGRSRPPTLWRGVALRCAALCLALLGAGAPALAQSVPARGGLHDDFGRLVLDFPQAIGAEIVGEGRHIELKFDRPAKLDLAAAEATLKSYVTRARPSKDGRSLLLDFSAPVTWQAFNDGPKLALDFGFADDAGQRAFDKGPDPATVELATQGAAASSATAPAAKEEAAPTVALRSGEHEGYSRLAFDWPKDVAYQVRQSGDQVTVSFGSPARIDLDKVAGDLPPRIDSLGTAPAENGVAVKLALKPGMLLRDFRSGRTVVLDIYDQNAANIPAQPTGQQPQLQPSQPQQQAEQLQDVPPAVPGPAVAAQTESAFPAPALTAQPAAPAPSEEIGAGQDTASAVASVAGLAPQLQSALPEAPEKPAAPPATQGVTGPGVATPVASAPPVAFAPPPSAPPAVEVKVTALPLKEGATLYFDWPKPVALAVFNRNGALWLVFDRPGKGDLKALKRVEDAIGKAEKVDSPFGFALRFPGGKAASPATATEGARWKITLTPGSVAMPTQPLQQKRETLANGGTSLYIQAIASGAKVDLVDPSDRARLAITPEQLAGLGVARESSWPDFKVLESYQGVVIEPLNDRPQVQASPNGVIVTTPPQAGGATPEAAPGPVAESASAPSTPTPSAPAAETPAPETHDEAAPVESAAPEASGAKIVGSLFDMPAWRRGGEATFFQDLAELKRAAGNAAPADKNKARLALAEFYLANGYGPEAAGLIDNIRHDDRTADGNPLIMAIGATAKTMAEEYDAALRMLDAPALQGVPEASLARGYILASRGDTAAAAKLFAGPLPDLAGYPKRFRTDARLLAAKALLDAGDPLTAQNFLDPIPKDSPDPEAEARTAFLNGLRALKLGKKEEALRIWEPLADSPIDEIKAKAQFELVSEQLAEKKIEPKDAVAKLEALRYLWRGDTFEFDLLNRLGHLYFDAAQPRKGLLTLRQAATHFPDHPMAKQAAADMTTEFRKLYLGAGADRLSPLTAVALYDEFRELTPPGPDGDRMIAALADRLVKVDLLDRAAALLERQVKTRLSGADKAGAGTRLAAVRLLDDKPDQALQALADSEAPGIAPALQAERQRLRARAMFDTGDTLKGIALIRDDASREGLWLKSDMFWKLREWPSAADALGQLIDAEQAKRAADAAAASGPSSSDLTKNPAAVLNPAFDNKLDQALVDAQKAAAADAAAAGSPPPAPGQPAATPGQPAPAPDANAAPAPKPLIDPVLARLVLNRAVALSQANDRRGLKDLGRSFGKQMDTTALGAPFKVLTSPDSGLAESITAQLNSVDQFGVFIDQYKTMLQSEALSVPTEPTPDTGPLAPMDPPEPAPAAKPAGEGAPTSPAAQPQTASEPGATPAAGQ